MVLAAWFALNQHDKRVAAEARVDLMVKELKPLQDQAEVAYKMIAVNDSIREREEVKLRSQVGANDLKMNQIRVLNNNQIEHLRQQLDSASKVTLDTIVTNYERIIALKDSQLVAAHKLDELRLEAIADRDNTIRDQRALIAKFNSTLDVLRESTKQSTADKVVKYATVGLAAVAAIK